MKGLESLERLRNTLLAEGYWQDVMQDVAIVEKELQALEIIKIKKFIDFNVYEMQGKYYLTTGNNYRGQISITKEEYDLLSEVLKDE